MFGAGAFSGRFAVPPGLHASDGQRPADDQATSATFRTNGQGETLAMSDRRKMIAFISSQLPHAERTIVLGNGKGGQVVAQVTVVGDDIEIASNCPEWATLREVYDHFRWNSMTSWEQKAAIRPVGGHDTASPASRTDEIIGRLEACLSAITTSGGENPPDATAPLASRPCRKEEQQNAMTTRDVAELLGCSYTEARERLLDGRIRAVKDGRWLRTRPEWVEEYIAEKTIKAANSEPDVHSVPVPRKKRPCQFTFEKDDAGYRFLKKLSEG
jgi:excisionase family DNA binding protein